MKEFCARGHALSGDNLAIVRNGARWRRRCKICQRAAVRKWYRENVERVRKSASEYAKRNREKQNAARRRLYAAPDSKRKSWEREYQKRNKEKYREYASSWRKTPKGRVAMRVKEHARRHKTRAADRETRVFMLAVRNDPCSYCGDHGGEMDHIVPLHHGGENHWSNMTGACKSCNSSKRDSSLIEFLLKRGKQNAVV